MADKTPATAAVDMKAHRARAGKAWTAKLPWVSLYEEAYRWVMPYRGRAQQAIGAAQFDHLFDSTAIISTLRGAGRLQEDLFAPGRAFFTLVPGPLARARSDAEREAAWRAAQAGQPPQAGHNGGPALEDIPNPLDGLTRALERITHQLAPFYHDGEWDNATAELCIDLYIGSGVMLSLRGATRERPIRRVAPPIEEIAFEAGAYGDVGALFWRTKMSRRAIAAAFPDGKFPKAFTDALDKTPDDEVDLNQDIVPAEGGGWTFIVYLQDAAADDDQPISTAKTKKKPFVAARYWRVPGETYGRGPALMVVPTVKTLNKAFELTLKAAAIQMLGIWGYRPGGTFNPAQIALKPGAFWPMQATGGVMGADVARLDPASGRMEISRELMMELRTQIQKALHDESLPDGGLTPKSAAEVMARLAQAKVDRAGAFGRMIRETIPDIVERDIEILAGWNLLVTPIDIDKLFVSLEVQSPLAKAMRADAYQTTLQAMQMVAALEGPQAVARRFRLDALLPEMIADLGVDHVFIRTINELTDFDAKASQAAQSAALGQALIDKPKDFAEVAQMATGEGNGGSNVVPLQRGAR